MRTVFLVSAATLLAACHGDPTPVTEPPLAPVIAGAAVSANPDNALSALVSVRVRHADSVRVGFRLDDTVSAGDSLTPAAPVRDDSAAVALLGLLPSRRYVLRVLAYGDGGSVPGDPLSFTTDTLPSDLPRYTAIGPGPSSGFVIFSAGKYGLAIDNAGRVVWYHRFPNGPGLNFQAQPSGHYFARPPTPDPSDLEPWIELDPLGQVIRTFGCVGVRQPRFHDLIVEPDGSYWLMCDETRTMDLSALGGVANAQVMGTVVQHVSMSGTLIFQWSPFDHFAITDLDSASRTGPAVNWTHGNALDLDTDGNLLVSFRSLNEITKISTATGDVMWRLGGLRNQFVFLGPAAPVFAHQHGLRHAGSRLLFLDNEGDPGQTRAERYSIDDQSRTARLVQLYGVSPTVHASLGGSVQDLAGGHTLVAFGNGNAVAEFDGSGVIVWRIASSGYIFRAQRIQSLYNPGLGLTR